MAKSSYFVLRREEAQRMHEAALSVLADIGMRVNGDAALKLIREAGCQVDNRTRTAKIPESLVNEAIKSAPKELVLASRNGNRDIAAPAVNTPAICTDGFAVDLVDSETGERRKSTNLDLVRFARMANTTALYLEVLPSSGMSRS
jgi:trimethylamine--corrinoid protein Co-methyltransferase